MKKVKLDRIDHIILEELQNNGRATNVEIAKKAGISAPPCLRRIHALEDKGIIKGYHAIVNSEKLGFDMMVFVHISIDHHSEDKMNSFISMITACPQVRAVYMMSGETDFLLQIVERDWNSLQKFMTQKLLSTPNVSKIKSYPALRCMHYLSGVLFDLAEDNQDEENEQD